MKKILFIMALITLPFTFAGCLGGISDFLEGLVVETELSDGTTTRTITEDVDNGDGTTTRTITTTVIDADGNEDTEIVRFTYDPSDLDDPNHPNNPSSPGNTSGGTVSDGGNENDPSIAPPTAPTAPSAPATDGLSISAYYNGNRYTCPDRTYTPIVNAATLQNIQNDLDDNYCLALDIDLTNIVFESIGSEDNPFTGTLEGGGNKITDLHLDEAHNNYIGLFAKIGNGGVVNDLTIENPRVIGKDYVGVIAGRNEGNITNVAVERADNTSNMVEGEDYVGGLIGLNDDANVGSCSNSGRVEGSGDNIGGLVGYNNSSGIVTSYSKGNVMGRSEVGGLVGYNNSSTITGSYSEANVETVVGGLDNIGGLVGLNNSNSNITDSHAIGNVTGRDAKVGGLVGYNVSSIIEKCYSEGDVTGKVQTGGFVGFNITEGEIKQSYSTGYVTGTGDDIGGFVGNNYTSGRIENCYSTGTVERTVAGNGGAFSLGGFAGHNSGAIAKSYATGLVTGEGNQVAGFVAEQHSGSTTAIYFDTTGTGRTNAIADNRARYTGEGIRTADIDGGGNDPFQSEGSWDFSTIWTAQGDGEWPTLAWQQ